MRTSAGQSFWVLVGLLLLTLWSTSQARRGGGTVLLNLAERIIPRRRRHIYSNNSEVCTDSVLSVHPLLVPRAGYKEEFGSVSVEKPVLVNTKQDVKKGDNDNKAGRVDAAAKSKSYGELEFPLFQKGDGSDEDPEGIPLRYLKMHNHNRESAKRSLVETLEWREEHKIDSILSRPHPDFDVAKKVFPHYFVARDKENHVVFVQRPAMINLELAHKNNLKDTDLLDHYVFVNEYLWQIVEKDNAMATMIGIIDLHGLNFKVMRQSEMISFGKIFVSTMDSHYPQRAHKTLVVNAPKWFHVLYKIISPLLRETTKDKIEIYTRGKKQDTMLKQRLGDKAEKLLPKSFFSKKGRKRKRDGDDEEDILEDDAFVNSELEDELRNFTMERINEAGKQMQEVL